MRNLPLGIQNLSEIIEGGMIYVDKTKHIPKLVDSSKYAFISRPRRFGKSLFISTLEEFFRGNRELFRGLDVYDYPKWDSFPVIRIDFSTTDNSTANLLQDSISERILALANDYEVSIETSIRSLYLSDLIESLHKKYNKRVVILIDEYDKPITDHFTEPEKADANRDVLRNIYSPIKGLDSKIRFMFFTGVSKFANLSLFSGLNQISDISFDSKFTSLFGYSQEELESCFAEHIEFSAAKFNVDKQLLLSELKLWYNGYSWDGKNFLYNPFSILSFFTDSSFRNFWFTSGSPNFLIKLIALNNYDVSSLQNTLAIETSFDSIGTGSPSLTNILFQTGYLTVKSTYLDNFREIFKLDFPNFEVKDSLYSYLFADVSSSDSDLVTANISTLRNSLANEDFVTFLNILKSLFAQIPSHLHVPQEKFYHSLFIMVMYMSRIQMESEVNTNAGRIDGVIEFSDKIYIIEFKYNLPPEDGLKQIKEKKYYEKYLSCGKRLLMIGVSFTKDEITMVVE
ncbi:MAG: ATP-binding protein [Bacteroidetes bacterium]|nr:ATP-binding protein [Bacteroidota bacterium]